MTTMTGPFLHVYGSKNPLLVRMDPIPIYSTCDVFIAIMIISIVALLCEKLHKTVVNLAWY